MIASVSLVRGNGRSRGLLGLILLPAALSVLLSTEGRCRSPSNLVRLYPEWGMVSFDEASLQTPAFSDGSMMRTEIDDALTPLSWSLEIRNARSRLIQRFGREGPPPKRILWMGFDMAGKPVQDTFFDARFSVRTREWGVVRSSAVGISLNKPPETARLTSHNVSLYEDSFKIILRIPSIHFAPAQREIDERAFAVLDGVAEFLKKYSGTKILVLGFADGTGDPQTNLTISRARAKAVYSYLVNAGGLSPGVVRFHGMGAKLPLANNRHAAGRRKNRRVEIWVAKAHMLPT